MSKRYIGAWVFSLVFVCLLGTARVWAANTVSFKLPTITTTVGQSFSVDVMMNADDPIVSADVRLNLDDTFFDIVSTTEGDFSPTINSMTKPGQLYVGVLPTNTSSTGKKGTATLFTVMLKAKKAGTSQLRFACDTTSSSNTSKLNIASSGSTNPNVIDCTTTGAQILNVSINTTTSTTVTPTPTGGSAVTGTPLATPSIAPTVAMVQPGNTVVTPVTYIQPAQLPQSGVIEDTIGLLVSGGAFVGLGGILRRIAGRV